MEDAEDQGHVDDVDDEDNPFWDPGSTFPQVGNELDGEPTGTKDDERDDAKNDLLESQWKPLGLVVGKLSYFGRWDSGTKTWGILKVSMSKKNKN